MADKPEQEGEEEETTPISGEEIAPAEAETTPTPEESAAPSEPPVSEESAAPTPPPGAEEIPAPTEPPVAEETAPPTSPPGAEETAAAPTPPLVAEEAPQSPPENKDDEPKPDSPTTPVTPQQDDSPPSDVAGGEESSPPSEPGVVLPPSTPTEQGDETAGEEEEEEEDLAFLTDLDRREETLSKEELESEEADFREKYGLDLGDEEEGDEDDEEEEEDTTENVAPPKLPSDEELAAIIRFLEEEREGEEGDNLGDNDEQEDQSPETNLLPVQATPTDRGDEPNVIVLGPDHPKMARFQAALNAHLKKQIYLADMEIRNMENELKSKTRDRTELGASLYNYQHEIQRQTETMERYEKEMDTMNKKRDKIEKKAKELKVVLGEMKAEVRKEEEKELTLRDSMKALDYTEHVVRTAAEKYEGELKIRHLVNEKLEKLRAKAESDKRDQDFYLDKVLTHMQSMELINAGIKRQIQAHVDEQSQLNTYINEAVTEIEALQIEKLHLQRAWNETVAVVRVRDDAIKAARETFQKVVEELRIRESELRAMHRLIAKEQEGHERSVILVRRRKMEERVLRRRLANLKAINQRLRDQLGELSQVRKTVEMELLRANAAFSKREKELIQPRRRLEALVLEKIKLEDKILTAMQEQSGLSKTSAHIQGLIKEARIKTRMMESEVTKVENENSLLAVDVEHLRSSLFKKTSSLSELEKRCIAQEKVLEEQLRDIVQSERIIAKKTTEVEKLNKKLEKFITKEDGVEMGPLEREIRNLEKQIQTEKDEVNQLQEDWLKRQDDLVRLSNQRDYLLHQNELLRKEVFIMERKRQRLDTEVGKKKDEINRIRKATEGLNKEISAVNAKLHRDKSSHDQMDKDNVLIQNEFVAMLKDAEMEALELERDIEYLEQERETIIHSLREAHEQNLSWEKKVRLAKELKDNLKKEQEGSNSALKLDIHHMTVRYHDIIRAQEKLMADLERSIERRDRIIQQADIALHHKNKNVRNTKLNIQRNFTSLREKNKLLAREAREVEQQVKTTMDNIHQLEEKLTEASNELNRVKETILACEEKIAEASILKHKNLVEIVLRQEKFRTLESIKYNRYKPAGRSVTEIGKMLEEAERDCFALMELAEDIGKEYPEALVHLKIVKASILPTSV
ncbi:coiled-coil domain-containing protein 40 [Folsomia candida]|nr:coiled-coil domain-containing protein 40 [Folsomia candida]